VPALDVGKVRHRDSADSSRQRGPDRGNGRGGWVQVTSQGTTGSYFGSETSCRDENGNHMTLTGSGPL
jgi:hypothetical protein